MLSVRRMLDLKNEMPVSGKAMRLGLVAKLESVI